MEVKKPQFLRVLASRGHWVVLAVLAGCVGGCTPLVEYVHNGFKVGPNYKRPPAMVAPQWIDAADLRVRSELCDLSSWWAALNDPVLNDLVQTAYRQNLSLREAGFRVLEARDIAGIAAGNLFPQSQDFHGDYNRIALSKKTANPAPRSFFSQWDYGFSLAWEIDFWGRFRRALEVADRTLDASVEDYDDVLVTLLSDVATNYVLLRTFQQQIEYVKSNVRLQRRTLKLAIARFKGGTTSELDVAQAQSNLYQTEAQVPELEIQARRAANRLCVLLGMPPVDLAAKLGAAPIPKAPPEVCVGVPADLLRRRPDVRRQERLAAAECSFIGVAEADFYPAISINGNIGYSAEKFGDLFNSKALQGSVGPSFQWKILNYGRILNNVYFHKDRFQELVMTYLNTVLRANEEVENGLVQFLRAHERARELAKSVEAAQKAVRLAIVQYRAGTVDFNRVALLQQNLVDQQNLYAQAEGEIAQGLILVYRGLGGGWEIRCQPPAGGPPPHPTAAAPAPSGADGTDRPQRLPAPTPQQPAAALPPPLIIPEPSLTAGGPNNIPKPLPTSARMPTGPDR
jgi:NodT family efflux transporter outer membrane factor (OMF) lipoprotein